MSRGARLKSGVLAERSPTSSTEASKSVHRRIHDVVARIPRGRIATYGQVARLAGLPGHARLVGYALHALPADTSLPWQRVVNAQGEVSTRAEHARLQRRLLEREGVRFDSRGRIPLDSFQWRSRSRARRSF
jgi:methylated-DNA-protein-cysteine methyltransferase-like protein